MAHCTCKLLMTIDGKVHVEFDPRCEVHFVNHDPEPPYKRDKKKDPPIKF